MVRGERLATAGALEEGRRGAVETFIIDWPVLLLLGFVFGVHSPALRWWRSRAFVAGAIGAAAFAVSALVSYAIAPDWMWMYFLDPDDVSWTVPLMLPAYLFVYWVAFGCAIAAREHGPVVPWFGAGVALVMEIVVLVMTWDRYHLVGTTSEWVAGRASELISASPTGPARTIGLIGPLVLATTIAAYVYAVRSRAPAADR